MTVGTLFGWLGDVVGIHPFVDGVPSPMRRRWNLVGFSVVDDPVNQWLTVTATPSLVDGDSSIEVDDTTGVTITAGDGAPVTITSTSDDVTISAGTGVGDTCAISGYAVTVTGTASAAITSHATSLGGASVIVTSTSSTAVDGEDVVTLAASDANTLGIGHSALPWETYSSTWVHEASAGITVSTTGVGDDITIDAYASGVLRGGVGASEVAVSAAGASVSSTAAVTVTAGGQATIAGEPVTIGSSTDVDIVADGSVYVRSAAAGPAVLLAPSTIRLDVGADATIDAAARATNAAPSRLTVRAASAWGSATGANLVGAALRLGGGRGGVPGTDKGGDVAVSLGRHIADSSTASFRITYGDATDDDFENTLLTITRNTVARARIDSVGDTQWASSGFLFYEAATEVGFATTTGGFILNAGNGVYDFYGIGSSLARQDFYPAKVTLASTAATTVATIAASASYLQRVRGTVFAVLGSDWAIWDLAALTIDANATATWGATTITLLDSGGAGSGWTCSVTTVGGNALLQVAAAAGVVVSPRLMVDRS